MKRATIVLFLTAVAALAWAAPAAAHCDAIDGPVASAALRALEAGTATVVLPWVHADAERELSEAFAQALRVRRQGGEAAALADRWFMETAVRLHRAGEHAPYTGLRPAGTDFGPAIPAAERALETGDTDAVLRLLTHDVEHGVRERFEHARALRETPLAPTTADGVAAARARVQAELGFVTYVEGLRQATRGAAHAE